MELSAEGNITYFNDATLKLAISAGQDNPREILPVEINDIIKSCLSSSQSRLREETRISGRTLSWSFHPVPTSNVVHCYVEDITDRLNLEAQLRQSQKMESIGQLAAGVAHDFNNMLTVIQGHTGMLMAWPGLPRELQDPSQAIFFAAERAANLTRQLLMFSRKNVMQLALLDLREVVTNMTKMLNRLLGETITLRFEPPEKLPLVQGDVGMIEQVLMNLAVNARDAMDKGGTLTISIRDVEIDDAYAQTHPDAHAGSFTALCVADTGRGIEPETMTRIFEPFFTTKEVGKGTGLGLATVYGIVKQHEGWIEVISEPGKGATFTVFFPARSQPIAARQTAVQQVKEVTGGKETILVVEDEPLLRDMAHSILEGCGYRVMEAASGQEALRVWDRSSGDIDLVLTDVVMPEGMSGIDLAKRLLPHRPALKVIFASGYSMEELDTNVLREAHALFLQKPYTHTTLAKAVRECLDR
jgi:signal transduction histidine kinase/CheY-like chemotaxis protein